MILEWVYTCLISIFMNAGNPRLAWFRLALASVSTVELFVTMARLVWGQTLFSSSECKKCSCM